VLRNADMVFVTAGLGGGTGSGAAPVIAQLAREQGALTIGVVTHPFSFEGKARMENARQALQQMQEHVNTMIAIPNDRLLSVAQADTSLQHAFQMADDILRQAVQGITDVVNTTGTINLDFADVRAVMSSGGASIMALGEGSGPNRASDAAHEAVNSNLLGITVDGANGILFNVRASSDLSAAELQEAADIVRERADIDVNFILGFIEDNHMGDTVRITLIATGFEHIIPAQQMQERVEAIVAQVQPPQEEIVTRRVYLTRPTRQNAPEKTPLSTNQQRFSTRQWGIPAYLRS
jgi:cell division protein FtsZ